MGRVSPKVRAEWQARVDRLNKSGLAVGDGVPDLYARIAVAGPPSPEEPPVPLPATVVRMPLVDTLRMRLLELSAMKRLPALFTATLEEKKSEPLVAGPPSPEKPAVPLPATVETVPSRPTLMTRKRSTMKRLPRPSTATSCGELMKPEVA